MSKTDYNYVSASERGAIYFKGVNGLRFFAALAVIITHIELLKGSFGFKHHWNHPVIFNLGGLGVYFFFVLSGFLITYLLLVEKNKTGEIQIKSFYIRRILRIWPLYYLITILGFLILPHFPGIRISYLQNAFEEHFWADIILYIVMLPNAAFSFFSATPHIGHLWSIGVEEQFYLFWPLIISSTRKLIKTMVVIIGVVVLAKISMLLLGRFYAENQIYQSFKTLLAMSKFECMAIGGIGAYLLFANKTNYLNLICNSWVFNFSIAFVPILIYITPPKLQDGIHLVFSVLFLVLILNVITRTKTLINLDTKYFSYLGKISYGIYMYHFMIVAIVLWACRELAIKNEFLLNVISYAAVIGLTIVVSAISYKFFEKPFIDKKAKHSPIKSTAENVEG